MIPNKKSSILLILKVLEEYSDEEHYLTQSEIVDKIKTIYGLELERKSVGSSLKILEDLDYDIAKGPRGGFALLGRAFDETEASFLIDAIFSSRSIDGKMAKRISDSISSCFSKYHKKDYSYIHKSSEITRTDNKDVLYNISIINEAMKRGKRVAFNYLTYDESGEPILRMNGYQYIVSPYYLISSFGRYYLLCNYREKYSPLQIFRLDYMVNIEVKEDWEMKPMSSLKEGPKDFSISEYINDHIYMLGGNTIKADLVLDGTFAIQYIKDWFGNNARIKKVGDEIHAYVKCDDNALYYWTMQYSDCVKVVGPEEFKNRVKEGLTKALERYSRKQLS